MDRPGPLKPEGWAHLLKNHPDKTFVQTLLGIITRGAKIGYKGPRTVFHISKNHASANEAPDILTADVKKQSEAGRLEILPSPLSEVYVCSPLGLVLKSDGGWRRIHDLSFPGGSSINDGIPKDYGALEYAAVDDAMTALIARGPGATMLKEDLADAFRHIPVAMSDRMLLGFHWLEVFYMELFLPFGLRTAPFLFDLFAKAVRYILAQVFGWRILLHYLDDFFTVLGPGEDPDPYKLTWGDVTTLLGLRSNVKKESAGTLIDFLGILFDSVSMEARLPPQKHARAMKLVANAVGASSLTHRELESLIGFLSFCAKVVVPGRSFLTSLYTALRRHVLRYNITAGMRDDLLWWHTFLPKWNGVKLLRDRNQRPVSHMWTDASGNWGMDGHWQPSPQDPPSEVFSVRYSTRTRAKSKYDIQTKEMDAVLYGLRKWLDRIQHTRLVIHCDNFPVVCGLRKGSMHGPAMASLRDIAMLLAIHDIDLDDVVWLDSRSNHLADLLSRGKYDQIADEHPQLANRRHWT